MSEARDRKMMDRDSFELLWNMLILLLRQKGQVEGSDLADLLLREKRYSFLCLQCFGSFKGQSIRIELGTGWNTSVQKKE